jgi:hypothetical protein
VPIARRTDLAMSLSHLLEALEHDHLAYRSVTLFGSIALVDDGATRCLLVTGLMEKHTKPDWNRSQDFLPRIELMAF